MLFVYFVDVAYSIYYFYFGEYWLKYHNRWFLRVDVIFFQEKKRQEMIALEKQLEEEQLKQARLAEMARANKQHLIDYMARVGFMCIY